VYEFKPLLVCIVIPGTGINRTRRWRAAETSVMNHGYLGVMID
jgi:hypothetical protein